MALKSDFKNCNAQIYEAQYLLINLNTNNLGIKINIIFFLPVKASKNTMEELSSIQYEWHAKSYEPLIQKVKDINFKLIMSLCVTVTPQSNCNHSIMYVQLFVKGTKIKFIFISCIFCFLFSILLLFII